MSVVHAGFVPSLEVLYIYTLARSVCEPTVERLLWFVNL